MTPSDPPAETTAAEPTETPAQRWRRELAEWRIPDEILEAAPESPHGFPPEFFRAPESPADTPSRRRAAEALPEGGTVLDVGCGGGAGGLALVPKPAEIVGVDPSAELLGEFAAAAARRGVHARTVLGGWPEVADQVPVADVVLCHHVVYNVPNLVDFVTALSRHARHRVVLELTRTHPMVRLTPFWRLFHDLPRPEGPTAELAAQVLAEAGFAVRTETFQRPPAAVSREAQVAFVRRRLCLSADRDPEIDAALGTGEKAFPTRDITTFWWDTSGKAETLGAA